MKGELPLFGKAKALQEELMMLMPEEPGDGVLEQEKYLLRNAKKDRAHDRGTRRAKIRKSARP